MTTQFLHTKGTCQRHGPMMAYNISPTYSEDMNMREFVSIAYRKPSYFTPHIIDEFGRHQDTLKRTIDISMVGGYYKNKTPYIRALQRNFDLVVKGRWSTYEKFIISENLRSLIQNLNTIKPVSTSEKYQLLNKSKIGINISFSGVGRETGNTRIYDVISQEALCLTSDGGKRHDEKYFNDNEIIRYTSVSDMLDKAKYFLRNDNEREEIARRARQKLVKDFNPRKVYASFLKWASSL